MNFIHDVTGSLSSIAAYLLAGTGLAIYFFRYLRKYAPINRKLIVKVHFYSALIIVAAILVHFLSTNKSNVFVYGGIILFAAAGVMGFALRISKLKSKAFNKIIYAKAAVVIIAALFITIGHTFFEEHEDHSSLNPPSQVVAVHSPASVSQ